MISNERPSPYGRRPYNSGNSGGYSKPGYGGGGGYGGGPPRPPSDEQTLQTVALQVERKTFVLTLKENPRGRFVRISEEAHGKRNSIIIPSTGLEDFKKILDEIVKASKDIPEKNPNPGNDSGHVSGNV